MPNWTTTTTTTKPPPPKRNLRWNHVRLSCCTMQPFVATNVVCWPTTTFESIKYDKIQPRFRFCRKPNRIGCTVTAGCGPNTTNGWGWWSPNGNFHRLLVMCRYGSSRHWETLSCRQRAKRSAWKRARSTASPKTTTTFNDSFNKDTSNHSMEKKPTGRYHHHPKLKQLNSTCPHHLISTLLVVVVVVVTLLVVGE